MTASPCCHPREIDLEDELAIARGALAEGDWKHALHHYLGALGWDAFGEEALTAIRRLHREHDLTSLLEKDFYVGAHIARAQLMAEEGKVEDACVVMADVDAAMPNLGIARRLTSWFDPVFSDEARLKLVSRVASAADVGMGRVRLLAGERAAIEPYAELAAKLAQATSDSRELAVISGMLRRAGRYDEAIEVLGAVSLDDPGMVPLALAHRAAGRPERAAEIFAQLFEHTNDGTFVLEQARALAECGRYAEAARTAKRSQRLLEKLGNEDHLFLEWVEACAAGDAIALTRNYDWVRRSALWHGAVPSMSDASTNILADPRLERGDVTQVTVSALESPSARLCLALHKGAGNDPRAVAYEFQTVPTPDPRLPREMRGLLLWHEVDGVMVQAVDAPSDDVRQLVAELTVQGYDLFSFWDGAAALASRAKGQCEALAAAMVHPNAPLAERSVVSWLFCWQVAAACLIACADTGWRGTKRRSVLLDLVRGPQDWTTAAAVLALGEVAVREPDALPEIRRELALLAKAIPTDAHSSVGASLALTAHKVPFFPPALKEQLTKSFLSEGLVVEKPPPDAAPLKKPWWQFW